MGQSCRYSVQMSDVVIDVRHVTSESSLSQPIEVKISGLALMSSPGAWLVAWDMKPYLDLFNKILAD
jgi:hypothetical protein